MTMFASLRVIVLSLLVSLKDVDAFSSYSFRGQCTSLRYNSPWQTSRLNHRTALAIWKTEQEDQTLTVESKSGKKVPANGESERFTSFGKLGDFTKFLRTEMDDIYEEELSMTDTDTNAKQSSNLSSFVVVGAIAAVAIFLGSQNLSQISLDSNFLQGSASEFQKILTNPTESLDKAVTSIESMGSLGVAYFCAIYVVAEILAIPAFPLTASAGYLFGVEEGTLAVLLSASIAAAVSFIIGRTLLRDYVEGVLEENPKFKQLDKAIGKEGFKLMLLLRLSPIFPFALSNYLYGATSVRFWPYFFGTMLGFTPGTIAYVYTGEVGKALTLESASAEPWYVYAGGLALISGFVKVAADVATGIIDDLENEDEI